MEVVNRPITIFHVDNAVNHISLYMSTVKITLQSCQCLDLFKVVMANDANYRYGYG